MNQIFPTCDQHSFTMLYCPPPPPPIQVRFTFNRKESFSRIDVDCILSAFNHLITRNTIFMERFKGVKDLNIAIIKNFHYDDGHINEKSTEHINCCFYTDDKKGGDTHHIYFTRNRQKITQLSKLTYEKIDF